MSVRRVVLASVSSALLAACVAASGSAFAASKAPNVILAEQAYQSLAAGDQAAAIAGYSQAIESRNLPTEVLANALLNRGLAHQQLSEHKDAIDDYTSALQLDAMSAQLRATALYNRGLSQQKLDRQSAAIEDFTSALFLDPTFAHAYYSRGNALKESGQLLFALSDYDKALRNHHPDSARVYYAQALAFEDLKRPADARKSLELAIAANPNFEQANQKLVALQGNANVGVSKDPILADASGAIGGNLTVRKPDFPEAVAPSTEMLGETAPTDPIETATVDTNIVEPAAKIADRLPSETEETPSVEEKIVAVETVDDAAPAEVAVADNPPVEADAAVTQAPTGWSVQVTSASSEDAAWSTWKKMQAKHRVLAGQKPVVVKADLGAKGIFYRVRIAGFDNQNAAKSTCSKLKADGVSCFVSKMDS
jgi:lipoprotein NlpI/cell division septation protein DedD